MNLYQSWMENWERRLTLRDRNRRIFPFSWGLDWLNDLHGSPPEDPLEYLKAYASRALNESGAFFEAPPVADFSLKNDVLTFTAPACCVYPENNLVHARLFPAKGSKTAVVVIPQWNADESSHVLLCRIFRALGITALRFSMPFHEQRLPEKMQRADYMVSPNIGRTLQATRQAVMEVRQLVSWLKDQGYTRVGIVGTSIGSCVGYLAFVHDARICTGVFNHVSSFFADVVWTGLSTRYVRWGLEGHISLEDLRQCWAPISPWFYIRQLKDRYRPHLLITAKYDLTFKPELAKKVFEEYRIHDIPCEKVDLPCGHYTTASWPFSYLDGWHICRFLRKELCGYS